MIPLDICRQGIELPSPIQLLDSPLLRSKQITLYVKREDLIHPVIGGNKWRKLNYNIQSINKNKPNQVLSFGGAYSNHIYALSGAGLIFGFSTIGIIRGEKYEPVNLTLDFAERAGMKLHYISRQAYRKKETPELMHELKSKFGDFYLIPEGGSNHLALPGCAEIIAELDSQLGDDYDCVCVPCGTAGTLAGLVSSNTQKKILGFSVLKGAAFLHENVKTLIGDLDNNNWEINLDYHFNGYAKHNSELLDFINTFHQQFGIRLEPVYSGKMFYGLFDLIKKNYFSPGSTIVALHTGGLQNEYIQ